MSNQYLLNIYFERFNIQLNILKENVFFLESKMNTLDIHDLWFILNSIKTSSLCINTIKEIVDSLNHLLILHENHDVINLIHKINEELQLVIFETEFFIDRYKDVLIPSLIKY